MMETRRRASVGSRRDFFHLVGSPIRTHKMSFDFADMQAGSPTQLRAPETPPPVNGLLRMVDEFPYISVQGHKKQIVPKNEQDPRDGTLIGFYGHSFGDADDYDDDEDDDHEPTSAMDVESAGVSGPLMLDARMAGIPLYMSNWFEADAAALAMAARAPAIKDTLKPHLRVNMADVAIGRVIGEGAFGKVFKAVWKNRAVAVKVLIRQDLTADVVHEFESEVKIMSYLHHDNICMLLGACLEPTSRALVIELVEHGSLWGVLRTRRSVLTDQMRAKFALDTARGMSYLHNFNLPILHRDMKSPNLLVEHDFSIKISDFGLARVKAQIQTMTGNCGTVQWMAYVGHHSLSI